jgi:DNA-binding FadR family transcriptional regulator
VSDVMQGERSDAFAPRPVQRPRQQVEDQLRQAILSGALGIGKKLPPEAALAVEFGVSRTTVREALRSLASDGLIEKIPGAGGGSFVRSVDHHSLGAELSEDIENLLRLGSIQYDEVAAVRRMLEVPAAGEAALQRQEADLAELEEVLAEARLLEADDPRVAELDARFHATLAHASGNRVLAAFVYALHEVTEPVHHLDLNPETAKQTYRQHQAVVRAVRKQDAAAAQAAMTSHLRYLEQHPRPRR